MSVWMRWDQCCESEGCTRPAHYGALCVACYLAATPARRAVEMLGAEPAKEAVEVAVDRYVSEHGRAWLEQVWEA